VTAHKTTAAIKHLQDDIDASFFICQQILGHDESFFNSWFPPVRIEQNLDNPSLDWHIWRILTLQSDFLCHAIIAIVNNQTAMNNPGNECLMPRHPVKPGQTNPPIHEWVKPGKTKGGTGHWPVSSGDPPDETEKRLCLAIPPKKCVTLLFSGRRLGLAPSRFGTVKPGKTKMANPPASQRVSRPPSANCRDLLRFDPVKPGQTKSSQVKPKRTATRHFSLCPPCRCG
jgi:hypothetical protein